MTATANETPRSLKCPGCNLTITKFIGIINNIDDLRQFLISHGVLASTVTCSTCSRECVLSKDKELFRCQKKHVEYRGKHKKIMTCKFCVSVRKDTFFQNSNLTMHNICHFVLFFVHTEGAKVQTLECETGLSRSTVIDWISFIREVLMAWALDNSEPILGGEGKVVEILEAKFGGEQYHRGKLLCGQWLFGGIERRSNKIFLVSVENGELTTLLSVIREKILPGTLIVSNFWKDYGTLKQQGYQHRKQSKNVEDPDADDDDNTHKPQNIKRSRYLAEYLFFRRYPRSHHRLHHIFNAIGKLYNPLHSSDLNSLSR